MINASIPLDTLDDFLDVCQLDVAKAIESDGDDEYEKRRNRVCNVYCYKFQSVTLQKAYRNHL